MCDEKSSANKTLLKNERRMVREARGKCSLDEWNEVVRKNCEAIRNEISNGKIIASGKIQRDIADTIILLNGRVDDSNDKLCRLIRYFAVLRADNISDEKELAEHICRMKSSEAPADLECKVAEKHGVCDIGGLDRLNASLADITKRVKEL